MNKFIKFKWARGAGAWMTASHGVLFKLNVAKNPRGGYDWNLCCFGSPDPHSSGHQRKKADARAAAEASANWNLSVMLVQTGQGDILRKMLAAAKLEAAAK